MSTYMLSVVSEIQKKSHFVSRVEVPLETRYSSQTKNMHIKCSLSLGLYVWVLINTRNQITRTPELVGLNTCMTFSGNLYHNLNFQSVVADIVTKYQDYVTYHILAGIP